MDLARASQEDAIAAFRQAGQGHVFRWWDELDEAGRRKLLGRLRCVDLDPLAALCEGVRDGSLTPGLEGERVLPDYVRLPETDDDRRERENAVAAGESLIRAGKVAALTVAGGQGTRLGYDAPKGTYPIGPVSGSSLFRIHAERILATQRRYSCVVPWYVMTSEATDGPTREYFDENDCLGLDPGNVRFFTQRMMPAVDRDFKLVLTARDDILLSPNGHGGTLLALFESGILDDMATRGVTEISYFQVDNVLVPAVDPAFLGYHHLAGAQMSSKTIWKREPEEPLGAFVRVSGELVVIEYSDLTEDEMRQADPDGKLVYGLGSPAIHVLNADFVRAETAGGFKLPFHLAEKNAAFLDEAGRWVEPEGKNVYKFETFIFDALRDTDQSVILEVRREEEFSPLKNKSGKDSVETCHQDMSNLYAGWLEKAGVNVPRTADGAPVAPIEISPLVALDAAELAGRVPADLKVEGPLYLGPEPKSP